MSENLFKLQHQLNRARKLADCIQFVVNSTHAELTQAGPTPDQWASISILAKVEHPSEETCTMALFLVQDRELYAARKAEERGHKGGSQTAKKGPQYYRDLQAKRRSKSGGRK